MAGKLPWAPYTHDDYLADFAANVIKVELGSRGAVDALIDTLDMRADYPWGRAVCDMSLSNLGLKTDDILLPYCGSIDSCHGLDSICTFPACVFFIRQNSASHIVSSTLLWDIPGISRYKGIQFFRKEMQLDDTLHTLSLGVEQRYIGFTLAHALRSNFYSNARSSRKRVARGIVKMRTAIKLYYDQEKSLDPLHQTTHIKKFTEKTFRSFGKPCVFLKAQGGETSGLVKFAVQVAKQCVGQNDKFKLLAKAGDALLCVKRILKREHRRISPPVVDEMMDACKQHNICFQLAGASLSPKHHRLVHMCVSVSVSGNPSYHSTFQDEHENGVVARQSTKCHKLTFQKSVFERIVVGEKLAVLDSNRIVHGPRGRTRMAVRFIR